MRRPFDLVRSNRLSRDERGVAVIELAVFAPILALMIVGVVDMSNAFNRKLQVEQAAQRAIEKVMQTTGTTTVEATIIAEAAAQANVPAANVTVNYYLECDNVRQADFTANCTGTEKESRYVEVEVHDTYTPMFPLTFAGKHSDGTYHIDATAGMRTK